MNIFPISNLTFNQRIYKNSFRYVDNHSLKCDTISFSGKKKPVQNDFQNISSGVSLGKKVLKNLRTSELSYEDLSKILNDISPVEINVRPLKECPVLNMNTAGAPVAHMLPLYGFDFRLKQANIYLGNLPQTAKEKTDFVANLAHEYTHVLQRAQDDNYYGILKYTQNPQKVSFIARASKQAMDEIVKTCQMTLFYNQAQVNKVLNSIIKSRFDIEKVLDNSNFEDIISDIAQFVSLNLDMDFNEVKDAMSAWIKKEALNEKEAYTVTLEVLEASKFDAVTRAKRVLSRELYSYIAKSLI